MKVIVFSELLLHKINTVNSVGLKKFFFSFSSLVSVCVHTCFSVYVFMCVCICVCVCVCILLIIVIICGNSNSFYLGCFSIPFLWQDQCF